MSGNAIQMTRGSGPFYEVWYVTLNHQPSGQAFWLRATLLATPQGNLVPTGGLWLARFDPRDPRRNLALTESYGVCDLDFVPGQSELEIGPGKWTNGHCVASFASQGHRLSYDLYWTPPRNAVAMLPERVKRLKLHRSDLCVPGVDLAFNGRITIDEETLDMQDSPGGQAHHWGRHYPQSWIWGHCNAFLQTPGAWVEMLAVKLFDLHGHSRPLVMLALQTPLRRLAISEPWQMLLARAAYANGRFSVSWKTKTLRLQLSFSARSTDFVAFAYTSPTDERYVCHNSALADCELLIYEREKGRERLVEELRAPGLAAAEFCTREETSPERYRF